MDSKDRAELDRHLDIAEKEQLLAAAPSDAQEQAVADMVLAEQRTLWRVREREVEATRQKRQQIAADAEWID